MLRGSRLLSARGTQVARLSHCHHELPRSPPCAALPLPRAIHWRCKHISSITAAAALLVSRRWESTTSTAPRPTPDDGDGPVYGNTKLGIYSSDFTCYKRCEFIGHLYPLIRPRADAGDILALIDVSAGHAAYNQVNGTCYGGRFVLDGSPISMATVAFNSFTFSQPVFRGDLIYLTTRNIHVGDSSVGIYVEVRRQAPDTPIPQLVGECFLTMVIVDAKTLRIAPGHVPAVRLSNPADVQHREQYLMLRKEAKRLTRLKPDHVLTVEEVELEENKSKPLKLKPEDCVCRIDRSFSIVDVNMNHAIFGGELLRFMERCALHCGRVVARQSRLFTLGMLDMTFDGPMYRHDIARCKAQVVCVHRSTLLVSVSVIALDGKGSARSTNRAYFILCAIDEQGNAFDIPSGIDLEEASQKDLAAYWEGSELMRVSRERRSRANSQGNGSGTDDTQDHLFE